MNIKQEAITLKFRVQFIWAGRLLRRAPGSSGADAGANWPPTARARCGAPRQAVRGPSDALAAGVSEGVPWVLYLQSSTVTGKDGR